MEQSLELMTKIGLYIKALLKWLALAAVTGLLCGLIGAAFHVGVDQATAARERYPWLLWGLPAAGLLIVAIYKLTRTEGRGTNDVLEAVHHGKRLPLLLLPAIFCGTLLTHLCGGSAGREGAALQMGGTVGRYVGRAFRLDDRDLRTATLCGMAAFFAALFGTPLAATMFAIMVVSVGVFYHAAFIPCFTASMVAYGISLWLGVPPTRFTVAAPAVAAGMMLRVAVLAVGCALVSILFCSVLHAAERWMERWFFNPWLRAVAGGCAVVVLAEALGTTDYNGAGMAIISAAVERGIAHPAAFLLKILFTAVTLGAGFKGGEVVPSFFVGATFGCVAGPLLGIPAAFGAALGLVAVFCGAVNCPVASIFLSVELFGSEGLLYFALACGISYMLSGYNGLYSSQTILYSKLKAQYINVHTNHHHAGETTHPEEDQEEPLSRAQFRPDWPAERPARTGTAGETQLRPGRSAAGRMASQLRPAGAAGEMQLRPAQPVPAQLRAARSPGCQVLSFPASRRRDARAEEGWELPPALSRRAEPDGAAWAEPETRFGVIRAGGWSAWGAQLYLVGSVSSGQTRR